MKVWKRLLIKSVIFIIAVAAAGAGGIAWKEIGRDTARYALEQYAQHLIDQEADRAYLYQDTRQKGALTQEEFTSAAEARKYSLYAGYKLEKVQNRTDENGSEYEDYLISYVNSDDEVQAAEEISVRKQEEKKFFVFDQWKVMPDHCLVKDFTLQVPAGAQVRVNGETLDGSLLRETGEQPSVDTYVIPRILPGTVEIAVEHEAFEPLTLSADTMEQAADLCGGMALSDKAKGTCLEAGVAALRELNRQGIVNAWDAAEGSEDAGGADGPEEEDSADSAGDGHPDGSEDEEGADETAGESSALFADCQEQAEAYTQELQRLIEEQAQEGYILESMSVQEYNPRYGEITFTESEGIQASVELAYHYTWTFQQEVLEETGEYDENWEPIMAETTREDVRDGDSTARLVVSYYDEGWHLTDFEISQTL